MIESTDKVLLAMQYAREAHHGQTRSATSDKWQHVPYFMHCIDVVDRLRVHAAAYYFGPAVYITGFLHDVVEDTSRTMEDIEYEFGTDISYHLSQLTVPKTFAKDPKKTEWQVERMASVEATNLVRAVKIADKTCNVFDMVRYAPPWSDEAIRGYLASAALVVATAELHGGEHSVITRLAHAFREEHRKAVAHYTEVRDA